MRISPLTTAGHAARRWFAIVAALAAVQGGASSSRGEPLPTADGFYGIWYSNAASGDQYMWKYSGGLGTYPQQTAPIAIYSEDVDRTYFLYGGTNGTNNVLKNYISYYDHATGLLARPHEVRHVGGSDVHRNATLVLDDDGYLWVFGNSHGNSGSGDLYRSANPHDVTEMINVGLPGDIFNNNAEQVKLAYSSPVYVPGQGVLVTYNQYDDGRAVHAASATMEDGVIDWIENKRLLKINGQYSIARRNGDTVALVSDYHRSGLDNRTNLYYLETNDLSQTWTTVDGTPIPGTLTTAINPALVHNYQAENRLVYVKDVNWDAQNNPIILYLTVSDQTGNGHRSGPQPGERTIHVAHWSGSQWDIHDVLQTKHNYSHGELYVEPDGTWRIIGPFLDGPQVYGTGGEVGVWTSQDQGASWQLVDQLTAGSPFNHTYVRRPVDAHEDFYAYWADGNAFGQSQSRLYFATKSGEVYRMPTQFAGDFVAPELMHFEPPPPPPERDVKAYEGFDYTGGSALAGQGGGFGWSGPWQYSAVGEQGEFVVLPDSLATPAYPIAPIGGGAQVFGGGAGGTGGNNVRIDRFSETPFSLAQDGVLYASFLFRKDVSDPVNPTSGNNMEFDLISTTGGALVRVGSTSSDQWFLNVAADAFGNVSLGETYFLVLKLEASAAGDDVRSVMIFDPAQTVPADEPATWDFSNSFASDAIVGGARLWIGRLAGGIFDEIRLGSTWASVTVESPFVEALPGDFNGDGVVDSADLAVWTANYGLHEGATTAAGDADGNGAVDGADFLVWQRNLGASASASATASAVPEPAAGGLAVPLLAAWGRRRPGRYATLWSHRDASPPAGSF